MSSSRVVERMRSLGRPFLFGMIHVPALPGTPTNKLPLPEILNIVGDEAACYASNGVDGIIVENMHDLPYCRPPIGPEIVTSMTLACQKVNDVLASSRKDFLLGVQVLAAANQEAMAVAHATGFDLIRAEGFVFSHVADEGWIDGCAGPLLRYRKMLGADKVALFTDIKKKHSAHAVTSDVSIVETAKAAEFFMADGVIVTGNSTGSEADPKELEEVKKKSRLLVVIGSGITLDNMVKYKTADGFIVGSEFKVDGQWQSALSADRISRFVQKLKNIH